MFFLPRSACYSWYSHHIPGVGIRFLAFEYGTLDSEEEEEEDDNHHDGPYTSLAWIRDVSIDHRVTDEWNGSELVQAQDNCCSSADDVPMFVNTKDHHWDYEYCDPTSGCIEGVKFSEDGSHFTVRVNNRGDPTYYPYYFDSDRDHDFVAIFSIEKGQTECKITELLSYNDIEGMVRVTSQYIFYKPSNQDTLSVMDIRDGLKLKEINMLEDFPSHSRRTDRIAATSILTGCNLFIFHGAIPEPKSDMNVAEGKYALHAVDLDTLETRHAFKDDTFERKFRYWYRNPDWVRSSICDGKVGVFTPIKEEKESIFTLFYLASGDPEKILHGDKSIASNVPRGKGDTVELKRVVEIRQGICLLQTEVASSTKIKKQVLTYGVKNYFETISWKNVELPRALQSWFRVLGDA